MVEFAREVKERDFFELVLHCSLRVGEVRIEHGMDIFSDGAGGIGVLVKVKNIPFHAVHRPVHVVQSNIF